MIRMRPGEDLKCSPGAKAASGDLEVFLKEVREVSFDDLNDHSSTSAVQVLSAVAAEKGLLIFYFYLLNGDN